MTDVVDNNIVITTPSHELSKHNENITKEYRLTLKPKEVINKKIKYLNIYDKTKQYNYYTNDTFIFIKSNDIFIDAKSSKYMKFSLLAPETEGIYTGYIYIEDVDNKQLDEVQRFRIEVSM